MKHNYFISTQNTTLLVTLLSILCLFHFQSFNSPPHSTHSWAQSDHYAVALNYYLFENSFFEPTTFTLNHQFPPQEALSDPQGITAIDFPIFHYVISYLMEIFNSTNPLIFRMSNLIYSIITFIILFKTTETIINWQSSLLLCAIILTQPIYAFYQNGFHISITAFNTTLIALSAYFYHEKKYWFIYLSIILFTIASLLRFTHIIGLIALFLSLVFNYKHSSKFKPTLLSLVCLIIVVAYFFYNIEMGDKYGSVFRNTPRFSTSPSEFLNDFIELLKMYFSGFTPIVHSLLFIYLGYIYIRSGTLNKSFTDVFRFEVIHFVGVAIFSILVIHQISNHDYYSLDTWTPVLVIFLFNMFKKTKAEATSVRFKTLTYCFIVISTFQTARIQWKKYNSVDRESLIITDFKNSIPLLNKVIDKPEQASIICNSGYNLPMLYWRKKTFRITKLHENLNGKINASSQLWYITQNRSFTKDIIRYYPNFANDMSLIAKNDYISIWRKFNTP